MVRAFVAAEISAKDEILRVQNRISSYFINKDLKQVDKKNLHFTLLFFGEIDEQKIDLIKLKLADIKFHSFNFNYSLLDGFPDSSKSKIIFYGVQGIANYKFGILLDEIKSKIAYLKSNCKERFVPHLTLFRLRSGRLNLTPIRIQKDFMITKSDIINKICFKQSILTPNGPIYSDILSVNAQK